MRDLINKTYLKDAIYKDVVVIGNGPSGISLSYMLSGHWPYWVKDRIPNHPDELLRARLNYSDSNKSLVLQDLELLADGLEGRSTNPVSLLLDSLQHPCADLGLELPSMLEYKYHPDKQIDHVVLGKGPAGGSWHRMDPNLRTLSLSAWMSLPGLDFNTWEETHPPKSNTCRKQMQNSCQKCDELKINQHNIKFLNNNDTENGALCCSCSKKLNSKNFISTTKNLEKANNRQQTTTTTKIAVGKIPPRRNLLRENSKEVQTRALISRVAEYYSSYVSEMGLEKHFQNNTIVTSVMPLNKTGLEGTVGKLKDFKWIVCGFNKLTNKSFCYVSKNIVLANGSSDFANRLGIRGEGFATPWIKHELPQLEAVLETLTETQKMNLKPVIIVGAGLSAADAVTICRSAGIHVIHVYRNRTAGLDKMLPENVYPEYHVVHKMMQNSSTKYDYYTPYPEHTISDISHTTTSNGGHIVTLQHLKTGETTILEVSYCTILIGSRPDLRFLSNSINLKNDLISNDEHLENQDVKRNRRTSSWLKNLCAKCKHINICDRTTTTNTTFSTSPPTNKRNDYKKICGHNKLCNENNSMDDKNDILSGGLGFGEEPMKPIDCKSNPIAVNKYTNRILNTPLKGFYAMGPLVSDNFVRFIPGGALAITSALHKEND